MILWMLVGALLMACGVFLGAIIALGSRVAPETEHSEMDIEIP